jgi:5-methylcytosine-specific restriction enzyme subunit McrC
MNVLFEEYVARLLSRALAGTGRQIVAQGGRRYCLETSEGGKLFQTKPDILVVRNGEVEMVIDTKWKRLVHRADDPKQGVAKPISIR